MVLMENVEEEEGKRERELNNISSEQKSKDSYHKDTNIRAPYQRMLYLHTDSFCYIYCLPQGSCSFSFTTKNVLSLKNQR